MKEYPLDLAPGDKDETLRPWLAHDWTPEEELFAREYLRTLSQVKAYRRAFPIETSELQTDRDLHLKADSYLRQPWLIDFILYQNEVAAQQLTTDKETVLSELAKVMHANHLDYLNDNGEIDLSGVTRAQASAIQEITVDLSYDKDGVPAGKRVKLKLHDKARAVEMLGRHHKLFTDVIETSNVNDEAEELRRARERARQARGPVDNEDDDNDE